MNPEDIETALRKLYLATIPDAANLTKFENEAFDPMGKPLWYAFHFLPNSPEVATLGSGGQDNFTGIVQVDINLPKDKGKSGLAQIMTALRLGFTAGTRSIHDSANVIIKSCGRSGNGSPFESWFRYHVTIQWECFLNRA